MGKSMTARLRESGAEADAAALEVCLPLLRPSLPPRGTSMPPRLSHPVGPPRTCSAIITIYGRMTLDSTP